MKIYHVKRTDGGGGYDTYSDFVVVAKDEHEARSTSPSEWDKTPITDDYENIYGEWVKYSDTEATLIGTAKPEQPLGVVCASFHAG